MQAPPSQLDPADYRKLSLEFRRGITNYYGAGKAAKSSLANLLCQETFDLDQSQGRLDLVGWSLRLRYRPRDLERTVWRPLIKDLIVDFNPAQGTYELRADSRLWWHSAGEQEDLRTGPELPLGAERPLSEAQSDLARQAVLKRTDARGGVANPAAPTPASSQAPNWTASWAQLKADLGVQKSDFGEEKEGAAISPRGGSDIIADGQEGAVISPRVAMTPQRPPDTPLERHPKAQRYRRALYACTALKRADADKARDCRGPGPEPPGKREKTVSAWAWLRSIDTRDMLSMRSNRGLWSDLCQRDPDYVLALKGALEAGIKKAQKQGKRMENPIRYLAAKIWDDRMFAGAK